MKFEPGHLYKHDNVLDIQIFVCDNLLENLCEAKLKVKYWNPHYKIFQGKPEEITINAASYPKWREIDPSQN